MMTSHAACQLIKTAFKETIENMNATETTYATYFAPEYVQYVDGKKLDYQDFLAHMVALKKVIQSANVDFKHMLVDEDKVATVHIVTGFKKDGKSFSTQVNAVFQIKNNKIVLCDELTHLLIGETLDRDLGSRC